MTLDIKAEVIRIMKPLFGEEIEKTISGLYDNEHPQEIFNAAHSLLTDFIGEESADSLLQEILEKFPRLNARLH